MTIFIAASGTGGHILPAVYIADAIKKISPSESVIFIGAGKHLEMKLIDERGFSREIVPISGIAGLGFIGLVRFILSLPFGLIQVAKIFKKYNPKIVVGVGGYVSVLPIFYAWMKGIPTWIHEAEHELGLANKLLTRIASKCSSSYPGLISPHPDRVVYTGHPIRSDLIKVLSDKREIFNPKKILIMGGSQGSKALDDAVPRILSNIKNLEVLHQCREENIENVKESYKNAEIKAEVVSFINDMTEAFIWCDLIISRAGAGSVMEISVTNKPVIFVPFPFAAGGHQKQNAEVLVNAGKALMVEEGEVFVERLKAAFDALRDESNYQTMRKAPFSPRSLTAAEEIAKGILGVRP